MKKILIIEDEMPYIQVLRDRLGADYSIRYALDGRTGLAMALAQRPKLILMDVRMPRLNGYEVLRRLDTNAYGQTVKVILLTNSDADHQAAGLLVYKPTRVFMKSEISLDDLIRTIHQLEPPREQ